MRVSIDLDRCETNALCTAVAPQVFEIVDLPNGLGQLRLLLTDPPESLHDAVREAAALCPVQAITIE